MAFLPSLRALKKNRRLGTEFVDHLAAGSARRARNSLVIYDSDGANAQSGPDFAIAAKIAVRSAQFVIP